MLQHHPHEGKEGYRQVGIVQGEVIKPAVEYVIRGCGTEDQNADNKGHTADHKCNGETGHDQGEHASQHEKGYDFSA